jgi:serine/threonine protein kinase
MAVEKLEQEHIIKFYAAIVQSESTSPRFYLMFERADGGNLLDFWKAFPSTSGFATETFQEIFLQLSGLVKALHAAHRGLQGVSMCHGNLKPAHILWTRGPGVGIFKLGGWEEKRFPSPESQYAAPDSEVSSPENDLWAFGCIFLEMLIWMLYGAAELHRFKASITDGHDEPEPSYQKLPRFKQESLEQKTPVAVSYCSAAIYWISHMEGDPAFRLGRTAADDLFEIVKADLLVLDRTKTSFWTFLRKYRSSGWLGRFKLVLFSEHLLTIVCLLTSLSFALNLYTRKSRVPVLFNLFKIFLLILGAWVILPPSGYTTQLDNWLELQSSSRIDIGDLSDRFDYITAGRDPQYWVLHSLTTKIPPLSSESITTNRVYHPKTSAYTAALKDWKQSLLVLQKSPVFLFQILRYKSWKRLLRPKIKWGHRRIEWRCVSFYLYLKYTENYR